MNCNELYSRIVKKYPLGQTEFIGYLNDALDELKTKYDSKYLFVDGLKGSRINTLNSGYTVCDDYIPCLYDYILYRISDDLGSRKMFCEKAECAYNRVWNRLSKGKAVKTRR